MKLKYVGPKPIISEKGISFKDGKEDKYIYLVAAIQILEAIDKDYEKQKSYSYDVHGKNYNEDDMQAKLLSYHPELEKKMEEEISSYEKHLDEELENLNIHHSTLNEAEIEAFRNNLNLMRDYRIQRAKNKIFYMHCIETIVEVIKEDKIKDIETPFYEKFWHVLQTIEGELAEGRYGIDSNLKIIEGEPLKAKLHTSIY